MAVRSDFKLLIYDFDGVLTDNRVWLDAAGNEMVACNRGDGWWIGEIKKLGVTQLILSTEKNPVVTTRAKKLGIDAFQGVSDKLAAIRKITDDYKVPLEKTCFVGNEMNDFEALREAGVAFCPSDSHPKIQEICDWVIPAAGGMGIVRPIYDLLSEN